MELLTWAAENQDLIKFSVGAVSLSIVGLALYFWAIEWEED